MTTELEKNMISWSSFTEIPMWREKSLSALALLVLTLFFSYLPFVVKKKAAKAGSILSYMNALAGGIVLGAMLMHMIPEMMEHGHDHGSCTSVVPSSENAVKTCCSHDHKHDHGHKHKDHDHKQKDHDHEHEHKDHDHKHEKEVKKASSHEHKDEENEPHQHGFAWGPFSAGISFLVLFAIDRLFLTHSHCEDAHPEKKKENKDDHKHGHDHQECNGHSDDEKHEHHHHEHHGGCSHDHHKHGQETVLTVESKPHGDCHEDDLIGCCHMDGINSNASKLQTVIFVAALSVHSFLEGLGMVTKSTTKQLVSFLISLFMHKWIEAFALGTGVAKAAFSSAHNFWLIFLYSILTPLGALLGMILFAISNDFDGHLFSNEMISQILDGLALGSFLFVSCIEMIPAEFHKQNEQSKFKFVALTCGFLIMALVSKTHYH